MCNFTRRTLCRNLWNKLLSSYGIRCESFANPQIIAIKRYIDILHNACITQCDVTQKNYRTKSVARTSDVLIS